MLGSGYGLFAGHGKFIPVKKLLSPKAHGVSDYGFAAVTAAAPFLMGFSKKARNLSLAMTGALLGYNLLTDHGVGAVRAIPFRKHARFDIANLAGLLLLPTLTGAASDKKAARFFYATCAAGVVNMLLTDWSADVE